MADLPYMQFFTGDWIRDTRMLRAEVKGAWIDTLAVLWDSPTKGVLSHSIEEWARLWGVSEPDANNLIQALQRVAEVRQLETGDWQIVSRRIVKDGLRKEAERNKKRVERAKKDKKPPPDLAWDYRELMSRLCPAIVPAMSPDCPSDVSPFPESRVQSPEDKVHRRPTLEQAIAMSKQVGITPQQAETWWNTREASDWMKGTAGGGTTPVGHNWQSDMKVTAPKLNSEKPSRNGNPPRGTAEKIKGVKSL